MSGSLARPLNPNGQRPKTVGVEWRLVLSHGTNMIGSKAWEFATPLLLVHLSGGRLIAPAVSGIASTLGEFLLGPRVGHWTDKVPSRFRVVSVAASVQTAAVFSTMVVLLAALSMDCGGDLGQPGSDPAWFAGSRPQLGGGIFVAVCLCGVLEALGRVASSVSVERDWVPTAFVEDGEAALTRINSRMANIDLLGEILGPLVAGVFFAAAPTPAAGFILIALLNVLSFGPQLWLLASARRLCPALQADRIQGGEDGEAAGETSPWKLFFGHPGGVALLSCSYAAVFFTVLSSHDVVLTAFLAQVGLSPMVLSVFRALGAAAGVLGASSFERVAAGLGTRTTAASYLVLQSGCVVFAAWVLAARDGIQGRGPAWLGHAPLYLVYFLAVIVLSRVGLYGFDVGFSTLSQSLVDERYRGAIGGVTEAICAVVQLLMYVTVSAATAQQGTQGFELLVRISAGAVVVAAVLFGLWCALYHEHEHIHGGGDGHGGGHAHDHDHGHVHGEHAHTAQQERALAECGDGLYKHRHVHFHPLLLCRRA